MDKESDDQERTSTTKTGTAGTTTKATSKPSAPAATAAKQPDSTEDLATPLEDLKAPPPRDHETQGTSGLRRKAESIINLYGIRMPVVNGKRCIQTERPMDEETKRTLREALRQNLI